MKIVLSELADNDMMDVMAYIAQDNIDQAVAFVIELEEQIGKLGNFPHKHPVYLEKEYGESVRVLHYKGYRVVYEISDPFIYVHEIAKDEKQGRDFRLL